MNLDPIDFFPGYDPYFCIRSRSRRITFTSVCTHLLAMAFAVGICAATFYYYDTYIRSEYEDLKRNHLNELFTKIYLQQESIVEKKIEKALDLYDADKVGLFDYASLYACGSVVSTPDTFPYPANKSISFFNLLNMDLLSNPESILQPGNLPGNCFAFYGTTGRMRIKLGKKISIKAITLDHIKLMEDASSAPKDFEVFGLYDPIDITGMFLGRFTYDLGGRPYQTFELNKNYTRIPFEFVELYVLNNHGRREFTCVYRFRVHSTYLPIEK
ncbi:hypothetical protein NQ314_019070 [Rhamnusium bicolor]|uniref:SUN domain-containing protein n=1 Tax=Rhamnusium bicolor TaxID=1586634 RepID=A0AAV8WQF6_9CUCU|nr:hypothetical protein NQ314_019070 [Rhamnusium bicolor]